MGHGAVDQGVQQQRDDGVLAIDQAEVDGRERQHQHHQAAPAFTQPRRVGEQERVAKQARVAEQERVSEQEPQR